MKIYNLLTILSFNPNNLGDLLCLETPDPNLNELPSPQRLRRKILVKAKRQMTTEDAVTGLTAASEPQLQPPRINEASIPLFSTAGQKIEKIQGKKNS